MIGVGIREVSESEAAAMLQGDREPTDRPDSRVASAVAAHLMGVGGYQPVFAFEMLTTRSGLVYVTDEGWPGSALYRVEVSE